MALVGLDRVARRFGDLAVLEGCTLQVDKGDRLGLVGENGCGKTTLLRILAGLDHPDEGARRSVRDLRVAVAEQIPSFAPGRTVRQAALAGLREVEELEHRLEALHDRLARDPEDRKLHAALAQAQERFEHLGGHTLGHRVEEMLCGLGFRVEDLDRPVDTLSGGEKSRVQLAGVLLARADLLLLDEPTNHLDLAGIRFLEGLLRSGPYTFLVVSHDRAFLDAVATGIVDIQDGRAIRFKGNYSAYVRIREMELERQFKEWQKQQEMIARQEDFYRRYHVGQRSREAKGRLRRLRRLEVLRRPPVQRGRGPRWRWAAEGPDSGYEVLRAEGVEVVVGEEARSLLTGVDIRVQTGERIGIVGPNGCGKTTLLRVLAGRLAPGAGQVDRHPKASLAWFDQEIVGLVPGSTVLQTLRATAGTKVDDEELRSHLALFLFSGEEVDKRVEDLSGGEARRLLLATLTWEPAGLLCLDEPTNHLDIGARESLEQALVGSRATILFVSHDRYFLEKVATQIWFLEPPRLMPLPGNWSEASRLKEQRDKAAPAAVTTGGRTPRAVEKPRGGRKVNRYKLDQLEERIFSLESRLEEARASQTRPEVYEDHQRSKEVAHRIGELQSELETLYVQWEEMGAE